jgi:hypothetical protein
VQQAVLVAVGDKRTHPDELLDRDKTMPGWTSSTTQCFGRRRTRSPNSPKSDRIRDDTTASPRVEHEAVLDADDPTDRLQPGCWDGTEMARGVQCKGLLTGVFPSQEPFAR